MTHWPRQVNAINKSSAPSTKHESIVPYKYSSSLLSLQWSSTVAFVVLVVRNERAVRMSVQAHILTYNSLQMIGRNRLAPLRSSGVDPLVIWNRLDVAGRRGNQSVDIHPRFLNSFGNVRCHRNAGSASLFVVRQTIIQPMSTSSETMTSRMESRRGPAKVFEYVPGVPGQS